MYKGPLVAKGYSQVHGLEYNETLYPIARIDSMRIVVVIAASKKW